MPIEVSGNKIKYYWTLYLFIAVPLLLLAMVAFQPIIGGIAGMFYRWNGNHAQEFVWLHNIYMVLKDAELWWSLALTFVLVLLNAAKLILPLAVAWTMYHLLTRKSAYFYRVGFVLPLVAPPLVLMMVWNLLCAPDFGLLNEILRRSGLLAATGTIAWLNEEFLIIPLIMFYGFPWIGAVQVLVYLAGFYAIPVDFYEAARVDGADTRAVFFRIEVPLLLTAIRINLILMIINTVKDWQYLGFLFGDDGIAVTPGLLMYKSTVLRGAYGYGCVVGFIMFIFILVLTGMVSRYIRLERVKGLLD